MTFNYQRGKLITKITDGKYIYLEEDDPPNGSVDSIQLQKNEKFEPIPCNNDRDVYFITGQSGSGKSYYTLMYVKNYKAKYPNRPIYLISRLNEDETLDQNKDIKRFKIYEEEFIDDPLTATDFKPCLIIFDDTDSIRNKALKTCINALKDDLLQVGRHMKISLCITSHRPCRGAETSEILNEAHQITVFPRSGSSIERMLCVYGGFTKQQVEALKRLKSRWVTVVRSYPQVVFTQNQCFLLSDLTI